MYLSGRHTNNVYCILYQIKCNCFTVGFPLLTADEAVLKDLCWVPFDIKTLPIEAKGGTMCLQPKIEELGGKKEDAIFLEVPPGAVSTCDNVQIRCAIIPSGPFTLPRGYQFGSMVVYISYDGQRVTKPLRLYLPHWYSGKDHIRDGLSLALSPHSLKEQKREYHFELLNKGEFPHTSHFGVVEIGGHCSLFAVVFKLGVTANYQAICLEKEKGDETVCDIAVTYASYDWRQVRFIRNAYSHIHHHVLAYAYVYLCCADLEEK